MNAVVRVMKNKFSQELEKSGRDDYDIFEAVRNGVRGDYENGLIFCGENPERIKKLDTVANVFGELTT